MSLRLKSPRGSIFFTTILLGIPIMLILAGICVDVATLYMTRSELHRTTDATALAAARDRGFNSTDLQNAVLSSQTIANVNPTHLGGTIGTLTESLAACDITSSPGCARITWGTWDPTATPIWSPKLSSASDNDTINAAQCSATQSINTQFLRFIGINSLNATAQSIATANPPADTPTCPLPFAPPACDFTDVNGVFTSIKCGTTVTFTTSSKKDPGAPPGTNTSAWVNIMDPTVNPTPPSVGSGPNGALTAFANGTCNTTFNDPCTINGVTYPHCIYANNGNLGSSGNVDFTDWLASLWGNSNFVDTVTIQDKLRNVVYNGKGLKAAVPIIGGTSCPAGSITQMLPIVSYAWFVVTQATDNQGTCAVTNSADPISWPHCSTKDLKNTVFGYYDCSGMWGNPTITPAPRVTLAVKLRLVQ